MHYIDTYDDSKLVKCYQDQQLYMVHYHKDHRLNSYHLLHSLYRYYHELPNRHCKNHAHHHHYHLMVQPYATSFPMVVLAVQMTKDFLDPTYNQLIGGEPSCDKQKTKLKKRTPFRIRNIIETSCSCSCIRCNCMSRAFNWAASANDRSDSSLACFSSDQRSRSLSEDTFALVDSVSRMRCSKFRIKSRNSCSLSCNEEQSCFTWASRSILSPLSLFRSLRRSAKIEKD